MNGDPTARIRVYTCPGCGRIVCYSQDGIAGEEIECPVCKAKRFSETRDQRLDEILDDLRKWKESHS